MTLGEFKESLKNSQPPSGLNDLLRAMWYDAKGDWEMSHNIAQEITTSDGSWVHAYLHRKEGDNGNARYWYHRADRKFPEQSLSQEWEYLVSRFLS